MFKEKKIVYNDDLKEIYNKKRNNLETSAPDFALNEGEMK